MRNHIASALIAAVALLLVSAAAAPPLERVTVTKNDKNKSKVGGLLIDADPDGIIVQPSGKAVGTRIPWTEVDSVSNGLNRDIATANWKTKNAARLCPTCGGNRRIKHDSCDGVGLVRGTVAECATCKGAGGTEKCTNPKCKDGKVECPGECLKLSVGQWIDYEGAKWRVFKAGRGTGKVSDYHIGEVWRADAKNGLQYIGPCPVCKGKAKIDCSVCHGKALLPCKTCHGLGKTGTDCPDCVDGWVACKDCKATGLKS